MNSFRRLIAGFFAGFGVVAIGACGGGGATCSADHHLVLDANQSTAATCAATEACSISTDKKASGCAKCDPALCIKGNDCIQGWTQYADYLKGDKSTQNTECRLKCAAPTDCPFNFHCIPSDSGQGYCAADRTPLKATTQGTPAGAAPWGVPCQPGDGFDPNKSCDSAQGFKCYGTGPTDANAYCTTYDCGDDADCAAGYWCATLNDQPDVTTTKRTDWDPANVRSLCLPRAYDLKPGSFCAPCKSDLDCPTNDSVPQHCVNTDWQNGATNELACAVECQDDKNCPLDYTCQDPGSGTTVCVPRAGTCVGDQTFCSPCHSDADCQGSDGSLAGDCVLADYSTEHYCTTKSGVQCIVNGNTLTDQCPANTGTPSNAGVSCAYNTLDFSFARDQCFGLVAFGTGSNATKVGGCWTKH